MAKKEEMKKDETTAVVAKQETAVAEALNGSWGMEDLDSKDILVPRIQMCQGMSKRVKNGEATEGEFVNTVTGESLGGITDLKTRSSKPITFAVVKSFKTWAISEKKPGETRFKYVRQEPMTAENALKPQEEAGANGVMIQNDRCLNFFLLLESEMAEGAAMPLVMTFKRTSYKAGQVIVSALKKLQMRNAKTPIWAQKFTLNAEFVTNDKGEFVVAKLVPGSATTPAEAQQCLEWRQLLEGGANIKVAEEEEHEDKDDTAGGLPEQGVRAADGAFEV